MKFLAQAQVCAKNRTADMVLDLSCLDVENNLQLGDAEFKN